LAHILINSVRPRSFVSHILLGLSSLIHRKYASKKLIDCLANLGLCGSYSETILFESSIVKDPENFKIADDSFIQCIYDNADHNTKTIDGFNTFHAMGGIMVVTPSSDDAVVEEDISNEQENDDIPENMFLLNICDNENISDKNVSDSNISDDENVPTKKQRI